MVVDSHESKVERNTGKEKFQSEIPLNRHLLLQEDAPFAITTPLDKVNMPLREVPKESTTLEKKDVYTGTIQMLRKIGTSHF